MRDVIVVGAGIIGATVALALRRQGRGVLVLDDRREEAGTPPSGGHLRPSWFGGMKKRDYEPAMALLDAVWGLHEEAFALLPSGLLSATVYRVDTDCVVSTQATSGTVIAVGELETNAPSVSWQTAQNGNVTERCRLLVIAAGMGCAALIPGLDLTGKRGVSFRFRGVLPQPFVKPWAPYKQVVAHQQAPQEIWVGDGSAILSANWTAERTAQCLSRCRKPLPAEAALRRTITGIRPYAPAGGKEPCLLQALGPHAWVATGAGKMGTIAAGWVACRLLDAY